MSEKQSNAVTFVLVGADGRMLIQERTLINPKTGQPPRYPGCLCFPGETIKPGVDAYPLAATIRGCREEYGLAVTEAQCAELLTYDHDGTDVDVVFIVKLNGDQVPVLNEGKAMHWMTLEQIAARELGFEQGQLIDLIRAHLA